MKVFNKIVGWESKVNFVDDNNVLLGFDTDQLCCEKAGWFISDTQIADCIMEHGETQDELPGWNFDSSYLKETSIEGMDFTNVAIFRITNGVAQKFIHLFNCHNGYYHHGFTFSSGDEILKRGEL